MTVTAAPYHPYDDVAPSYDTIWGGPEALAEDREIMERIAYTGGSVLDIGCGTGLFLDHYPEATRSGYVGIDPSAGMLQGLKAKHPHAWAHRGHLEGSLNVLSFAPPFDLIISLYGSPSYIEPDALRSACRSLLAPGGQLFLMFIADGYEPITHQHITNPPPLFQHDLSAYGTPTPFGNYVIVES
jgi:SAM-dependent methyltransferase